MKFVLGMAIVAGFSAVAANAQTCREGDTRYWPSNNPALCQNSEGGACQNVAWSCVNGNYVEEYTAPAPQHRSCMEGDVQNFPVADSRIGNDSGSVDVPFVCRHGKYTPVNGTPKKTRHSGGRYVCKNGSEMYFEENSSRGGGENGTVRVLYTCKNGRFVKKYAH